MIWTALISLGLASVWSTAVFAGDQSTAPAAADELPIQRLIDTLADKSFRVRDAAARQLSTMENARPALRRALKSTDAEVSLLAGKILEALDQAVTKRSLTALQRELAQGRVDLAVERFSQWDGPDNETSSWQSVLDFTKSVNKRAGPIPRVADLLEGRQKALIKDANGFGQSFQMIRSKARYTIKEDERIAFLRSNGLQANDPCQGVFVSANGFQGGLRAGVCLLLVNGDIKIPGNVSDCVLVCDGDVELNMICNSIIIAKGKVTYESGDINNSIIISSGSIKADYAKRNLGLGDFWLKENDPIPLNFIKWFTPADVGLEVAFKSNAVKVDKLHDGKLPLRSGLKLGDTITAVDGAKVDSLESFRKLLRGGFVRERCILSIQRGGSAIDVTLDFRAEERAVDKMKEKEKK